MNQAITINFNAEKEVANFLKNKGWVVAEKELNANGFDIVAIRDNKYLTIEVKKASYNHPGKWRIKPVSKRSRNCDYIAIVLPNKFIYFQKMEDHFKCIGDGEERYITYLVDLYC